MHEAIRHLARELGVNDAELLLLAREAAHDLDVRTVDELTEEAGCDLISALLRIQDQCVFA